MQQTYQDECSRKSYAIGVVAFVIVGLLVIGLVSAVLKRSDIATVRGAVMSPATINEDSYVTVYAAGMKRSSQYSHVVKWDRGTGWAWFELADGRTVHTNAHWVIVEYGHD